MHKSAAAAAEAEVAALLAGTLTNGCKGAAGWWQLPADGSEYFSSQEAAQVHAGADATFRSPLRGVHGHALHRGLWGPVADPDAL